MTTNKVLRNGFVLSAWLLIGVSAWQLVYFLLRAESYQVVPASFQARVFIGPLVIGGMEALFWLRFFAHERQGARIFAAMMGFFMLVLVLVSILLGRPGGSIGQRYLWFYMFVGIVHLCYAVGAKERSW